MLKQTEATLRSDVAKVAEEMRAAQLEFERTKAKLSANFEAEAERRVSAIRGELAQEKTHALQVQAQEARHDQDVTVHKLNNDHIEQERQVK